MDSVRKRLQGEVEETISQPFYSNPQTLYDLFELEDMETEPTKRKICMLWNYNQERPEYKDFDAEWTRTSDRQSVESQYKNWLREIRLLEKIANLQKIQLQRTEPQICKCQHRLGRRNLSSNYSGIRPKLSADGLLNTIPTSTVIGNYTILMLDC